MIVSAAFLCFPRIIWAVDSREILRIGVGISLRSEETLPERPLPPVGWKAHVGL